MIGHILMVLVLKQLSLRREPARIHVVITDFNQGAKVDIRLL